MEITNVTPYRGKLSWKAPVGAKSYVIQQSPMGLAEPAIVGQIRYVEETEVLLEDIKFAGTTRSFSVIAFFETYPGTTEEDRIRNAMNSGAGSPRSEAVVAEFPAIPGKPEIISITTDADGTLAEIKWNPVKGAKAYVVQEDRMVQPYEITGYTTDTSFRITSPSYPGTTVNFTVTAFAVDYPGETVMDKAQNALESGEGSEVSDPYEMKFPLRPAIPTDVEVTTLESEKAIVKWKAGSPRGKAWIAHSYPLDKPPSDDPKDAVVMWYDEDKELILTPAFVGVESLAGLTIKLALQEYDTTGKGDNDVDKAKDLNENGLGSEWTDFIEIKFPEAVERLKHKK